MRITTWNVNGLRAALRKGFGEVVDAVGPDVLLLQEVRATVDQLPGEWREPEGWHVHYHPAQRPGYAGTAVFSREPIGVVSLGTGDGDGDEEGRLVLVETGGVRVGSVYLPSGSSGEHRQAEKEKWMARFRPWADGLVGWDGPVVLGGDFNIARTPADIYYARSNEKNSGYLPHERAWMDELVGSGWQDTVRDAWPDEERGPYSWWSNRGRARELDRGWRIDYLLANGAAQGRVGWAAVDRELSLGVSDHAPVSLDLE